MGSPREPTLANLFMGNFEITFLNNYSEVGPKFYNRYVNDMFYAFSDTSEAQNFLNSLNAQHPNINFSLLCKNDGFLMSSLSFTTHLKNSLGKVFDRPNI